MRVICGNLHFKDMLSPEQKVIIKTLGAHKGKYKFLITDSATTHLKYCHDTSERIFMMRFYTS